MIIQFFLSCEGSYSDQAVLNVSDCWNEYQCCCWLISTIL
jgi:hypothetical protein